MKIETEKALRKSIKKWEDIVSGVEVDDGTKNCALCRRFMQSNSFYEDCSFAGELCPVRKSSGDSYCFGTPYMDWLKATKGQFIPIRAKDDESVMCAVLELEFLRSLLPKRKK